MHVAVLFVSGPHPDFPENRDKNLYYVMIDMSSEHAEEVNSTMSMSRAVSGTDAAANEASVAKEMSRGDMHACRMPV
jgi:hypothetical protein